MKTSALQFDQLVELLPIGVICFDQHAVELNRAAKRITGYENQPIPPLEDWFKLLFADQGPRVFDLYRQCSQLNYPIPTDPIVLHRADGGKCFVEVKSYKLEHSHIWLLYDVTRHIQTETELGHNQQMLASILNSAHDAIVTFDQEGTIKNANPATEAIFGYTKKQLLNANISLLIHMPYCEEAGNCVACYLKRIDSNIFCSGREVLARRRNGDFFYIDLVLSEIEDLGLLTMIVRDISERKELQRQILEIAAEEDRKIGQEIHDGIQQEITAMEMFAEMLRNSLYRTEPTSGEKNVVLPIKVDQFLSWRETADTLCKGLATTHLHVHQLSRGILPVDIDAQGLNAALSQLAESTDLLEGIRCSFESPEIIEVTDNTVATHLYKIAQEAVNNSLRHSHGRDIEISMAQNSHQITLEISDNGIGLDKTVLEDFQSKQKSLKQKGIGLYAMHYRAGLIGATLQITTKKHKGTTITCIAPRFSER